MERSLQQRLGQANHLTGRPCGVDATDTSGSGGEGVPKETRAGGVAGTTGTSGSVSAFRIRTQQQSATVTPTPAIL